MNFLNFEAMLQKIVKQKYAITVIFFLVWMMLFDSNSSVFMYKQYNELKDLKQQEVFLHQEIEAMTKEKEDLFSNDDLLEKYARENYYFKKDNEDVFYMHKDQK
jgi:cell division protein DivIC